MDKIIVCDNFLTESEIKITLDIINNKTWHWGHESISEDRIETPFWSCNLINDEFFAKTILKSIEKHFSKKFKINRIYANAQSFGQDGIYHIDSYNLNDYTFCFYIAKLDNEFIEAAGGHLFFKIKDLPYKICYEPVFNRGILFPSNYLHKACSFTRYFMDLRICIAWKLEEIIE